MVRFVVTLTAVLLLSHVALAAELPPSCHTLESIHGRTTISSWLLDAATVQREASPDTMCAEALQCKRILAPLIAPDGSYKRECPNDCSQNGVCCGGVCQCLPGYSGEDCREMRCPGGCNSNGRCVNGKCNCDPNFTGDACDTPRPCPTDVAGAPCGKHGVCKFGQCFCDPGFDGPACTEVASCLNNCNGRGMCSGGECACSPTWGGEDCSVRLLGTSCENNCHGHGTCANGQCLCDEGYYGEACEKERECPVGGLAQEVCGGHGKCVGGKCLCDPGRKGSSCVLEETCPGNGTCSGRGLCYEGSCYCFAGYTGSGCEQETDCGGCSGAGVCVKGECRCVAGAFGDDCSKGTPLQCKATSVPANASTSNSTGAPSKALEFADVLSIVKDSQGSCPNSCTGHGLCVDGQCICVKGYEGADCGQLTEQLSCPNDCSLRGACVDGVCHCLGNYKGIDCSEAKDEAKNTQGGCPKDCSNRGTCTNGVCTCSPGYAGEACEVSVPCKDNCNGAGSCMGGRCFCFPGFEGAACEKKSRCPAGCSNHGSCLAGRCHCDPYYSGEDCSQAPQCSKGCHMEHGICRGNDNCVCADGYMGVDCSLKITCPETCKNGVCALTETGKKCRCSKGWTGPTCDRKINECPNDCSGNGNCLMGKCECKSGFVGLDCGSRAGSSSLANMIAADLAVEEGRSPEQVAQHEDQTANEARFAETRVKMADSVASSLETTLGIGNRAMAKAGREQRQEVAARHTNGNSNSMRFAEAMTTADPEDSCPDGCSDHGVCSGGNCFCDPGFEGANCGTAVECPAQCNNHGICQYGKCWCDPRYEGEACALQASTSRHFPQAWVTAILCSVTFFVGIIVGRKTLARNVSKLVSGMDDI